jgi:hypothetical protein
MYGLFWAVEGRAHIMQTSNNLYEKKYSIGTPYLQYKEKVLEVPPPQGTDAEV